MSEARLQVHLLVVEDNREVRQAVTWWFRNQGAVVYEATDVTHAMTALADGGIDMVCTDWDLFGKTSQPIVEAAQAKGLPVVVLTGDDYEAKRKVTCPIKLKGCSLSEVVELLIAGREGKAA